MAAPPDDVVAGRDSVVDAALRWLNEQRLR
jgi:hypothetical protein